MANNSTFIFPSPYKPESDARSVHSEDSIDIPLRPLAKGERAYKICDWTLAFAPKSSSLANEDGQHVSDFVDAEEINEWAESTLEPRLPVKKSTRSSSIRKLGWGLKNFDKRFKAKGLSVKVEPFWSLLEEIEFSQLSKLQFDPDDPETLLTKGSSPLYDRTFDRASTRQPRHVEVDVRGAPQHVTISEDPEIAQLSLGSDVEVYMSDLVCTYLMTCSRPFMPWDIVVRRWGSKLFFDKRDESDIDLVFINETTFQTDGDDIDSKKAQAQEATAVNFSIPKATAKPPFAKDDCTTWKYKKWSLGETTSLLVRCAYNSTIGAADSEKSVLIRSLIDYDPKLNTAEWNQKLDSQRGAVLAQELKQNNALMARWVSEAILCGADILKLVYLSKSTKGGRFSVVGVEDYEPVDLASQTGLNVTNCFGILKTIVETVIRSQDFDEYVLMKDPSKPMLRIYGVDATG